MGSASEKIFGYMHSNSGATIPVINVHGIINAEWYIVSLTSIALRECRRGWQSCKQAGQWPWRCQSTPQEGCQCRARSFPTRSGSLRWRRTWRYTPSPRTSLLLEVTSCFVLGTRCMLTKLVSLGASVWYSRKCSCRGCWTSPPPRWKTFPLTSTGCYDVGSHCETSWVRSTI